MIKQEIRDILYEATIRTAPASGATWFASIDWSGILATTLIVLQILYLLRKWWREETEWGVAIKKFFGVKVKNEPSSAENADPLG